MFESLQLWLASIKCTDPLVPLDGYGVDSVEDLKMLEDKHISELCFETPQDCLDVAIKRLRQMGDWQGHSHLTAQR